MIIEYCIVGEEFLELKFLIVSWFNIILKVFIFVCWKLLDFLKLFYVYVFVIVFGVIFVWLYYYIFVFFK